jgi:hypothetical protein
MCLKIVWPLHLCHGHQECGKDKFTAQKSPFLIGFWRQNNKQYKSQHFEALSLFCGTMANHAETVETRNETNLQKLGLNTISTEKAIISTNKAIL